MTTKTPKSITPPDSPEEEFRVEDKRHWTREIDEENAEDANGATSEPRPPSIVDEYRQRAEQAEAQLREYIAAFKSHEQEQEAFRQRLLADVDRRVSLQFGELLTELLESVDDLNRGLDHVRDVAQAEPLAQGVVLARDRFLATLARHGVEEIAPGGKPFDPNDSEAVRVDPVDSADLGGMVTEVLRPGYRLGERVLRPAQVAVGRHTASG